MTNVRIHSLQLYRFPVPFKTVFRHASASRREAENVIVAARTEDGTVGYGEGCPRAYVTGETVESAAAFIQTNTPSILEAVRDIDSLRTWIAAHRAEIDTNPAAFCAIELAILDLLGKRSDRTVEQLLGVPVLGGSFQYSAILGDTPYPIFWWQARRYWRHGFRDFKLKVSGDFSRDCRRVRHLTRRSGEGLRLRLDANNLWPSAAACIDHVAALDAPVFAIEEPTQEGDLDGFRAVANACSTKIILDESLLRPEQLGELPDADLWIANLRVSKMGGLIRTLKIAKNAAERGIGLIVGAQVGETSLLTRAGLTVMAAHRARLWASEGAFGTYLLQRDLTTPCLMFGDAGALDVGPFNFADRPGLGLHVNDSDLSVLTEQ